MRIFDAEFRCGMRVSAQMVTMMRFADCGPRMREKFLRGAPPRNAGPHPAPEFRNIVTMFAGNIFTHAGTGLIFRTIVTTKAEFRIRFPMRILLRAIFILAL